MSWSGEARQLLRKRRADTWEEYRRMRRLWMLAPMGLPPRPPLKEETRRIVPPAASPDYSATPYRELQSLAAKTGMKVVGAKREALVAALQGGA